MKPFKTVYSYPWPEVKSIVDRVFQQYPHAIYERSIFPEEGGLDNFHEEVIDNVIKFYSEVNGLRQFSYHYPTSGSEEGIREIMTFLRTEGVYRIYMYEGEYEGYREVAKSRGIEINSYSLETDPRDVPPGYWFLSNPSAIHGNWLREGQVQIICDAGHQVIYDLAYLGSTAPCYMDLTHPNIFAALLSFSKPYGRFYDRIGFTFARNPIPSLYANKWFKSLPALLVANAIVTTLKPNELYQRHARDQAEIVRQIEHDLGWKIFPSSTLLLAYLAPEFYANVWPDMLEYRRGEFYRFCLTPYYLVRERNNLREMTGLRYQ